MRILAGLATLTAIVNSLVVGFLGEHFGMAVASVFYGGVAACGFIWTLRLNTDWAARPGPAENWPGSDLEDDDAVEAEILQETSRAAQAPRSTPHDGRRPKEPSFRSGFSTGRSCPSNMSYQM